jgi:surfactin family lipopeptide synthetase A
MMSNTLGLSEAKRVLLEKYLRGDLPQPLRSAGTITRCASGSLTPLSFGQQQMWLLAQLAPDSPMYNESVTIHLPGSLNVAALEQGFNEIIRRHEAWRTSFPTVGGEPIQMIHPPATLTLPVVDLRYLPEAEREVEAMRLATGDARILFDLAQGPLLRARLVQLDDAEHRLFLTLHQSIFDGVSLYQVFLPELRALYEAFSSGKPSPLPDLPIQYADFAVWQRLRLQGDILADQLAYWKQQLAGAPAALEWPTGRPRPLVQTYRGSMRPFALSKWLTDAIKALSRQEGVTLFMVLLAAFNTLLYRYTGQDDLLIGTSTAGRKRLEIQGLMGFFLNTLVLRTNLSGNPTLRELLVRVREVTNSAFAHEDVPFEYLVKELHPERHLGQNPLFQVMLTLEPSLPVLPSGWTLTQMDVETDTAEIDLYLELDDRPEGLIGRFEYSTDLFDAATIDRMVGHWQTLLEGIVANPNQHLAELPFLTEAERQQLLVEWNNTATDYPRDNCIHHLFEAQVERTPDAVAVVYETEQLTYRELNRRANQLAHYLRRLGVGPEVLVGLCMKRSLEMIVGMLGILKAGGAYVPLDPAYPSERIAFMLEDAHVSVLVTQQQLTENLPRLATHVICLDADWEVIAHECDDNLSGETTSENLAYVIYTSGSTGRPKGVAIAHRSTVAFIHWARSVFTPEELAGVLASTSICFDLSVFEIFVTLSSGGTIILAENLLHLPHLPSKRQVTLVNTVPSVLTELLRGNSLPSSVQTVNLAGEPLHNTLVQQLYRQETIQRVYNLYGPTEDTTYSTYVLAEKGEREPSIGRPISNTQVYILDSHLQPVPIGVAGELYIGGDGLARGYLNRPELTSQRFIPHPFSDKPNMRLYKTGDLARYMPDGNIEYLGRLDHQVKIRGFRIELGEIEALLRQHPQVREVVVVAREDSPGNKCLVAYIVAVQGQPSVINTLRSYLQEKLPDYMIPSAFVLLDTLPLTPNGKVDRRALPAPEPSRRTAEEGFVAPKLTMHYQLVQIWEELLDVRPIGIQDNFFYLGGHSLLAARLVARIEQVFGKKIPLATLFAGPTIEKLANALQQQADAGSCSSVVAVQTGGSKRPFFFLHGDFDGSAFYCFPLARNLGSDQPFYLLEPYRFDDLRIPPTFEAMAAAHINSMRTIQPEGPYLLGGYCNGGLVAYEMARQLHAEGQTVDLLVLMNPTPISEKRGMRRIINRLGCLMQLSESKQLYWFLWLRHMYRYLQHGYRYLRFPLYKKWATKPASQGVNPNEGVILTLKTLHEDKLERDAEQLETDEQIEPEGRGNRAGFALPKLDALFPEPIFPSAEALHQDYWGMFCWVASDYVPGLYPGKSTFFFTRDSEERGEGAEWLKVAAAKDKEVEVHHIAGTHRTCRTTQLHDLTEHLRLCLNKVQAAEFGRPGS